MKRIDLELVDRGLFETRNKAQYAINNGVIYCNGKKIIKKNYLVDDSDILEVKGKGLPYVSKGGLKLEKALKEFNINLFGKKMIDIGASTGGFTDCALQYGVDYVFAIDVGKLQISPKLRSNKKIKILEQTDFRKIEKELFTGYTIATIDVSFISVTKLLKKIQDISDLNEIILLIKPQFECGMEVAKKYKGVILNKKVHLKILNNIIKEFNNINYGILGLTFSPIKGGSGNIEYLAFFKKNKNNNNINCEKIIKNAFIKFNV